MNLGTVPVVISEESKTEDILLPKTGVRFGDTSGDNTRAIACFC
jgi:hypothetical protein